MTHYPSADSVTSTALSAAEIDDAAETPFPPNRLETRNPLLYRIILGALLLLAVFLIFYSWKLGIGSLQRPASGLWVFIVAGLIVIALPGALLVSESFEVFDRDRVVRALVMVGSLFLFVALYPFLGFVLAGAVSVFIISRWSAEESIRNSLVIAILTPVVLYLLFGVAFSVSLDLIPSWL